MRPRNARNTYANRVPGENPFTADLNCRSCYDPFKDFVLNPKAWIDPPDGQFGSSAAYYNDYRDMRRPSEAMSLGRIFRIKEGVSLNIRADFRNIFNRTVIGTVTATASNNAKLTQVRNPTTGETTSGFGDINTQTQATGYSQRAGMIVARITF